MQSVPRVMHIRCALAYSACIVLNTRGLSGTNKSEFSKFCSRDIALTVRNAISKQHNCEDDGSVTSAD